MSIELDDITKENFAAYERVRKSGRVNMWSGEVQYLANITRAEHIAIMKYYKALCAKWPDVRNLKAEEKQA